MTEKRTEKRLEIELNATCRLQGSDQPLNDIQVVNLNHSGMGFIGSEELSEGDVVEMMIDLDGEQKVCIHVVVVWSSKSLESSQFRTGVKMIDQDTDDLKTFKHFVDLRLLYPPNQL